MNVVTVETLLSRSRYSDHQIWLACWVCAALGRGKLILVEPPAYDA